MCNLASARRSAPCETPYRTLRQRNSGSRGFADQSRKTLEPGGLMSVSPIGSAGVSPLQQSPSSQGNWQSVLNSAAGTLGLSTTALQQQLQSGQSLGSIAQGKGVSQQ